MLVMCSLSLGNALFKRDAGSLSDMKSLNHCLVYEMAVLEKKYKYTCLKGETDE